MGRAVEMSNPRRLQSLVDDLPPKARAALQLLIAAYPEPVSRHDLADIVWNGEAIANDRLVRCIGTIRRHLASHTGWAIHTHYGLGYQLVATGPSTRTRPHGHGRLAEAASGRAAWAETPLVARTMMDPRDRPALDAARRLLEALVETAPRFAPARLLLAELLARLLLAELLAHLAAWEPGHGGRFLPAAR
ncbi:MAG: helix-turn-helix domain-containing protein, partial [Sphingomonadaceae bacterium]